MISLIVVIFLALGGGASFVAESSIPGDALYIVKTQVNEPVWGAIASSPEGHAHWEAQLASRRLNEAAELQLRGTLTDDMAKKLNTEFSSHADAAVTEAQKITSAKGNLAMDLRTSLLADVQADGGLFAERDAATGKATGKSVFVLPHVLEATYEVKSPRDSATGQATGKIAVPAGDVTGDGVVHPVPAPTSINVELQNSDATLEGSGGANAKTGGTQLQATYDLKAMKK